MYADVEILLVCVFFVHNYEVCQFAVAVDVGN